MTDSSLADFLTSRFTGAIAGVTGIAPGVHDPLVRAAQDPRFGDYQCNAAMPLAKALGRKPREIAEQIVAAVDLTDAAEPLEIAGPGFINVRLKPEFVARYLSEIPDGRDPASAQSLARLHPTNPARRVDRVGILPADRPQSVVIDYSSPNVAKQMHVGHIRSTIIGDVFARVLSFRGDDVIRQNHVGDWGTAMGMVILGLWYIESRHRLHHENDEVVEARVRELARLRSAPPEQRRAYLEPICREWSQDVRDTSLHDYSTYDDVDLDALELGYRFIQAAVTIAEGTGITVTDPEGRTDELAALPRRVTFFLQRGSSADEGERQAWRKARQISIDYCQRIYDRLGVLLTPEDVCGESFYQDRSDRLGPVVRELREKLPPRDPQEVLGRPWAEIRDDQGAVCLFMYGPDGQPRFKTAEGDPLPMIIQKSDGAYLYDTTDLAAMRYRITELGRERLMYVTDARQKLRFQMLFEAGRLVGWVTPEITLEHVTFGSILGEDRKPLKTREGGSVKLADLLDEAERRAYDLLRQREQAARDESPAASIGVTTEPAGGSDLSDSEKREVARQVGIAAVKYADLARDRNTDYIFNWDKMLAFQGNTAPYMMYAYARIRSIYRKAAEQFGSPDVYDPSVRLVLEHPTERALGLRLARLRETIESLAAQLEPHTLCNYLYDLASDFMRFYESCPVVQAPDPATRMSRMRLCDLTARSLKLGLWLLGIEAIERM